MSIEKQTKPYEFLARFNDQGIQGMHIQNIEKVFDTVTGEIISIKQLQAQSVEEASEEYNAILSSINTAIQTENTSLKEEKSDQEIETVEEENPETTTDVSE